MIDTAWLRGIENGLRGDSPFECDRVDILNIIAALRQAWAELHSEQLFSVGLENKLQSERAEVARLRAMYNAVVSILRNDP